MPYPTLLTATRCITLTLAVNRSMGIKGCVHPDTTGMRAICDQGCALSAPESSALRARMETCGCLVAAAGAYGSGPGAYGHHAAVYVYVGAGHEGGFVGG